MAALPIPITTMRDVSNDDLIATYLYYQQYIPSVFLTTRPRGSVEEFERAYFAAVERELIRRGVDLPRPSRVDIELEDLNIDRARAIDEQRRNPKPGGEIIQVIGSDGRVEFMKSVKPKEDLRPSPPFFWGPSGDPKTNPGARELVPREELDRLGIETRDVGRGYRGRGIMKPRYSWRMDEK